MRSASCSTEHEYTKYIILKVVVNLDDYDWPDISREFFAWPTEVVRDDSELRV